MGKFDHQADAVLVRLWNQDKTLAEIAEVLGVTKQSVMRRARVLRTAGESLVVRPPAWESPSRQSRYLRNATRNAAIVGLAMLPKGQRPSYEEIAAQLGVTRDTVSSVLRRRREAGEVGRLLRRWGPADDRLLRRHHREGVAKLSRRFGRDGWYIRKRLLQLGLPEPPRT